MPVERWSERISIVHLADDPQFIEDMHAISPTTGPAVDVVLDFSAVTVINSSNLSAMLRFRKLMIERGARLLLCSIPTQVWGTFLVTGLDNIFQFSDSVSSALARMQMDQRVS